MQNEHKKLYNKREWRRASVRYRRENPLCVVCQRNGKLSASEVVDHIVDHKGDQELFWDKDNWQPLCKKCHDEKTRRENPQFEELAVPMVIVLCGPPGSGKTKVIADNIIPGDAVVDFDALYHAISGQPMHRKPRQLMGVVSDIKERLISRLSRPSLIKHVWVKMSVGEHSKILAVQQRLNAKVFVLNVPPTVCVRNCQLDRRKVQSMVDWSGLVKRWHEEYARFEPHESWTVIEEGGVGAISTNLA